MVEEKKETGPKIVKVQVMKTTYIGTKHYSPTIKGPGKDAKEKIVIIDIELSPRIQGAIDQGILKLVKE